MLNSLFQWRPPRASFHPDKLLYMGNVPNRWSGCKDELDEVCKWSILTSSVEIIVRNVNKITRNIRCLPHMDKPVGSWFAQMVNKIQDSGKFRPGNTFTICTNQFHDFPFIKDGFKEMEHKFLFGTFSPEKQDYLFGWSVALGNVPLERLQNVVFHWLFQPDFPDNFYEW